jgi:hypothetical protein
MAKARDRSAKTAPLSARSALSSDQESAASPGLMSFDPDPGHAPVLRYDIPSATEFEIKGWLPIVVSQSAFKENLRTRPVMPPYAVLHHPSLMSVEAAGTDHSRIVRRHAKPLRWRHEEPGHRCVAGERRDG